MNLTNLKLDNIKRLETSVLVMARKAEAVIKEQHPNFTLDIVKFDWSPTRTAHRGGRYKENYGINMAMYRLFGYFGKWLLEEQKGVFKVHEYASYDHDPVIGGFLTDNLYDRANCYTCHEVAHAGQFFLKYTKKIYDRPHGESFRLPYRLIRNRLVNPFLPNQKEMQQKYNELTKKAIAYETNLSS